MKGEIISMMVKDPSIYWYEFDYRNQPTYPDDEGDEIPQLRSDEDRANHPDLWIKMYGVKIISIYKTL